MFRPERVVEPHLAEVLRRKAGHPGKVKGLGRRKAVPNLDAPVAHDADDVARVGRVHPLPVLRHERGGVVEAHRLPGAVVDHLHALLEFSGTDAHKRHAVVVLRVHVRLNLEGDAREAVLIGGNVPGHRGTRLGRRGDLDKRVEHIPHPEVAERTAEEDRGLLAVEVGLQVQLVARLADEFHVEPEIVGLVAEHLVELWVAQVVDRKALVLSLHVGVGEEVQLIPIQVVGAAEAIAHPDGPGERHSIQIERVLNVL